MLVKDYMIKHPPMVGADMPILEAQYLMNNNNIRHLPVVKDGKRLVGLITREVMLLNPGKLSSLDVWDITHQLSRLKVKDVMIKSKDVITIAADTTIEQAAQIMVENGVACLPVIHEQIVVGLLTETDLLTQLTALMAVHMPGVRVTVRMPMITGELAKLVAAIAGQGLGIVTMGGAAVPKDPSRWDAVVKIRGSKDVVLAALSTIEGQEIIDLREV
ncbi:MAG: CBS domain-containing protein [Anaerolineae bacterium]|nr:CBS domain-containing protein [Anaerolineae bacterium]